MILQLDLDRPQHRVILKRFQKSLDKDVLTAAVIQPDQKERYADILAGMHVRTDEPSVAELDGFAALVEAADELRGAN